MKINIASNEIIHFIGIEGIGMSGLAQIMNNMGFKIQGSDQNKNKNTLSCFKSGSKGVSSASTSLILLVSSTDCLLASLAARMVRIKELTKNINAIIQVSLVRAVLADLLLIKFELPPPTPKPPPSERCKSTAPIKIRAIIRWIISKTFSILNIPFKKLKTNFLIVATCLQHI